MDQITIATVKLIAQSFGINQIKESSFIRIVDLTHSSIMTTLSYSNQILHSTKRTMLTSEDINLSLQVAGIKPLCGYFESSTFDLVNAGVIDSLEIFAYDSENQPIESVIRTELPPYPIETHFEFDWIAKNGHPKLSSTESESDFHEIEETQEKTKSQTEESSLGLEDSQHSITHELHVFYSTAKEDLNSTNPSIRENILYHLHHNHCTQILVPYFIRYSMVLTRDNLSNDQVLNTALNILLSLSLNSELNLINYSHLLLTCAFTFLLSSAIRPKSMFQLITFRDLASDFLRVLSDILSVQYPKIQVSIVSTLTAIFESKKHHWLERYGAFAGLAALGSDTIAHCESYLVNDIAIELKAALKDNDREKRFLARVLQDKIIDSFGSCFHRDTTLVRYIDIIPHELKSSFNYQAIVDAYGSRVLEYCYEMNQMAYSL